MFNDACNNMLRTEICGGLSTQEMTDVLETLESHNIGKLAMNGGVELAGRELDIGVEVAKALMAETVSEEDNKFVKQLQEEADTDTVVDFKKMKPHTPAYMGEHMDLIAEEIRKICKTLKGDNLFVICAPLELTLLQCGSESTFDVGEGKKFKGPNNCMLVGFLSFVGLCGQIPIYSHIPYTNLDSSPPRDDCEYIIGTYNKEENVCYSSTLTLYNVSFV